MNKAGDAQCNVSSICCNSPSGQERRCLVQDCHTLKPGSIKTHSSLICDPYCNPIDVAYNSHSSDDMRNCTAINIVQIKSFAVPAQHQIPPRHTSAFPILPHYPPSAPRSLSKTKPTDGSALAQGRSSPDCLPQHALYVHCKDLIPFYSM